MELQDDATTATTAAAAPLRILISGCGIAGPAVAFWLSRLGHSCTIVERFPSLRANGQQIDLREQGVDAAKRMGILDEVRRRRVDERGVEFLNAEGKTSLFIGRAADGQRQSLSSEFEIMRGDLCRLLMEAAGKGVSYRFDTTVQHIENDGAAATVTLSDGSVETYDLVIAADGQSSRIRKKMLAEYNLDDSSRSLGCFICYFTINRQASDGDKDRATVYHSPGKRFTMTRWHSKAQGQGYFFTMAHADELRMALKQDTRRQKDVFANIFHDAGWQAQRLIGEMEAAGDFYAQEVVQILSSRWSKGSVVLLGDAGYAPSPFTGMGTSLALVGAYVLAGEIARHPGDLPAALEGYQQRLRPLVDEVQQLPPGFPRLGFAETALGIRFFHMVLWLIYLGAQCVTMLRIDRMFGALSALLLSRRRWELPEYPELDGIKPWSPGE